MKKDPYRMPVPLKEVLPLLALCLVLVAAMVGFSWLLEVPQPGSPPNGKQIGEDVRVVALCAPSCRPGRNPDEIARNHYEICVCGDER